MRRHFLPAGATARARELRREATDAEKKLWYGLRERFPGTKFRFQVPMGRYVADFASHDARLIVEVDGAQHGERLEYDRERTRFLNGEGYRVLRFWNNEVLRDLDGVLAAISRALSPCGIGAAGSSPGRAKERLQWLGEGPAAIAAEETLDRGEAASDGTPVARRSRAPAA